MSTSATRQRVLLVDDDVALRTAFAKGLSQSGYDVDTAESGEQAIDALQIASTPYRAVVTDLVMSGASGADVAAAALAADDNIRVLIMSGSTNVDLSDLLADARVSFLPKPFSLRRLVGALAELLSVPS